VEQIITEIVAFYSDIDLKVGQLDKYNSFKAFIASSALNLSTNPQIFKNQASFFSLLLKHKMPNHVFNFGFRLIEIPASLGLYIGSK